MTAGLVGRPVVGPPNMWIFPPSTAWNSDNGVTGRHIRLSRGAPGSGLFCCALIARVPLEAEPDGQDGVANVLFQTLLGGTTALDAEQFTGALDEIGAQLSPFTSFAGLGLRLSVPRENAQRALALLCSAVRDPALSEREARRQVEVRLGEIVTEQADPAWLADHTFYASCFTPQSRHSRPARGDRKHVTTLDAAAVRAFYQAHIGPDRVSVLSAGSCTLEQVRDWVSDELAGWSAQPSSQRDATVPTAATPRTVVVDHPGAPQTQLLVGCAAIDRQDPRWPALRVSTDILGGGITSRLNKVLREQRGYTYGASARTEPFTRGGAFLVRTAVAAAATTPALRDLYQIVHDFVADGPTKAERDAAIARLLRQDAIRIQTPAELVAQMVTESENDLPAGWFDDHRRQLASLDSAYLPDLLAADKLVTVVVGDLDTIGTDLRSVTGDWR